MESSESVQRKENRAAQAEEMEALHAIYGEDFQFYPDAMFCEIQVHPAGGEELPAGALRLRVYFVESYPSDCAPVAELKAPWITEDSSRKILTEFGEIYRHGGRDVVVFKWVDWLQGQCWLWEDAKSWGDRNGRCKQSKKDDKMKAKDRPLSEQLYLIEDDNLQDATDPADSADDEERRKLEELDKLLGIVHGPPFSEKKSVFQAHLAAVQAPDQVEVVMDALLRNRKIAQATHNIMAYRISVPSKGVVLEDYDDDGETAAGGRLMHLLQIVDACNVMVVVSRWFGGVLLGPDRFRLINNAARSILMTCGYVNSSGSGTGNGVQHKTSQKSNVPPRTTITMITRKGRKK